MSNPFATDEMAAGYATSRPPVHPRVLEQALAQLPPREPFRRALDVGCGAGVSTRALSAIAPQRIGMEPAVSMLRYAATVAPGADFLAGAAEAIPIAARSVDLMTAAGSLNYADLDRFFPEASRVLTPNGTLLVYDFSAGRSFAGMSGLDEWFDRFMHGYPAPPDEGQSLSPEILEGLAAGFHMRAQRRFEIPIRMTPCAYLNYVLTETNVAAAVRNGIPISEIRTWCADTLAPVWNGEDHDVLFRGYFACLSKAQ